MDSFFKPQTGRHCDLDLSAQLPLAAYTIQMKFCQQIPELFIVICLNRQKCFENANQHP